MTGERIPPGITTELPTPSVAVDYFVRSVDAPRVVVFSATCFASGGFSNSRATLFKFAEMRFLHFPNDPIEDKVARHGFSSGAHRLRGRVCSLRARFCVEKHSSLGVSAQFRRDLFLLQALLSSVAVAVGLLHVLSSSDCPIKSGHRRRERCVF